MQCLLIGSQIFGKDTETAHTCAQAILPQERRGTGVHRDGLAGAGGVQRHGDRGGEQGTCTSGWAHLHTGGLMSLTAAARGPRVVVCVMYA